MKEFEEQMFDKSIIFFDNFTELRKNEKLYTMFSDKNARYLKRYIQQKYQVECFIWVWHEDHAHIIGIFIKRDERRIRWNNNSVVIKGTRGKI